MTNLNSPITVVILDGGSCNSLGILRCFGERKIPVILLSSSASNISRYSRYGIKELFGKNHEYETNFIDDLVYISKKYPGKKLLFPSYDQAALFAFKNKEFLSRYFLFPPGDYEVLEQIIDKGKFYKLLGRHNIEFPKTYYMDEYNEDSIISSIEYPCIIKPCNSYAFQKKFKKKCYRCETEELLRERIRLIKNEDLEFIIQKHIDSDNQYMFYAYFDKAAQVKGICGYKKIRQNPPDYGSGCSCLTEWRDDLIYPIINFLEGIRYRGIAEPEFIKDRDDGRYKLLEINARSSTQNRLPAFLGLDIEYMVYCDTIGKKIEKRENKNESIAWIELDEDIKSYFRSNGYRKKGMSFHEYLRIYKYKKVFAVFAWNDIFPFMSRCYQLIRLIIKQIITGHPVYKKSDPS